MIQYLRLHSFPFSFPFHALKTRPLDDLLCNFRSWLLNINKIGIASTAEVIPILRYLVISPYLLFEYPYFQLAWLTVEGH